MTDIYKDIGKQLRRYRRLMGFSQTEVAEKLRLKSSAIISRWEQGVSLPSLDNALKLSVIYKTLVNELFWEIFTAYRLELLKNENRNLGHDP